MAAGAASYYAHLTAQYRHYGGDAHGWHYGLWEPDVTTHTMALRRSNERLLSGLDITPDTRILDVGFGEGGFSVWAARTTGAQVTGITVCREHVALAGALAAEHGVADRCRFLVMNMDALTFDANEFDIVVNQETACYSSRKPAYYAEVLRVLKPGGVWRSLDFSIQDAPLSPDWERSYRAVCDGFHIPSLTSPESTVELMQRAGFDVRYGRDITNEVLPTARMIRRQCLLPLAMKTLHLDWIVYSSDDTRRRNRQGHIAAAYHYSRGLERGVFRYTECAGYKPEAAS